jgi:hypothetical protein
MEALLEGGGEDAARQAGVWSGGGRLRRSIPDCMPTKATIHICKYSKILAKSGITTLSQGVDAGPVQSSEC